MSASHNPGGPEYDWGIKVNYQWHALPISFFFIIVQHVWRFVS